MASLTVTQKRGIVEQLHLGAGQIRIGRSPTARIHIKDGFASWEHAVIEPANGNYLIKDLGSTNGTLLNGQSCNQAILKDKDIISIADFTLEFFDEKSVDESYSGSERTMVVQGLIGTAEFDTDEYGTQQRDQTKRNIFSLLLLRLLPVFNWAIQYKRSDLRFDFQAGLIVAFMLVPQGMAYALLAGLPPIHGLYASTLPLILYALMGICRQLSVAPVALDSLLVAAGVGALAQGGTETFIHLAIVLALMVGVIQVLMSALRMGFVVNFISQPVLTGFMAAAALIITVSQLRHLLGLPIDSVRGFLPTLQATASAITSFHLWTAAIGIGGIILLNVVKKLRIPLPGPILLVVISTLVCWLLKLDTQGVVVVGELPQGIPIPELIVPTKNELIVLFTLACVGFMEAITIGKSFGSKYGYRVNFNTEFRAIGFSNIGSHLVGGFPITGGLSRSAVNANSGAKTQLASIVAAILVILSLLFLMPLFYYVPIATLAAIIMTSVMGLIKFDEIRYLYTVKIIEIIVLAVTLLSTLIFGITVGLLAGIGSAMLVFIIVQTKPTAAVLGRLPGTQLFRSIQRHPDAEINPDVVILRIDASFYFANAEFLRDRFADIVDREKPQKIILLDASAINDLDSSGDSALREIFRDLNRRNIHLYLAGIKGPARDVLKHSGLYDEIGPQYFFYTLRAAMKRIEEES